MSHSASPPRVKTVCEFVSGLPMPGIDSFCLFSGFLGANIVLILKND
jgi:membrane protein YqaA with SNARE-associated domain